MNEKISFTLLTTLLILSILSCSGKKDEQFNNDLNSIHLKQGDVALCGSLDAKFGTVDFDITCEDIVRDNFNLAVALLHSFEYDEAEKVFAKVIRQDPQCVMAYWGVAMANYHTLWAMLGNLDLEKGYKTVALARTLKKKTERESDYLEAIGAFYDDYDKLDHKTRALKFEKAMEKIYTKYPSDKEAAVFYALALTSTADPVDKTYPNQRKAGDILNGLYPGEPNHPGIAHYIIHTYDYPELAELALHAARTYADIAPASAHAQHMPSHIFTRLGLWDESIKSNEKSVAAARCYAENVGMHGHWDEELHGMDYLVYAYLQEGRDSLAKQQVDAIVTMKDPTAQNAKSAYVFAALPARYSLERKNWHEAADLKVVPDNFAWQKFPWENAITHFTKLLGYVHLKEMNAANEEMEYLNSSFQRLTDAKETYKANQVKIQITAGDAWLHYANGDKAKALELMRQAADMEDATGKHPVTPGEVVPARELLGDLLMEMNMPGDALDAYELDLVKHPNRFNGLYGAGMAAEKTHNSANAKIYFNALVKMADVENCKRPAIQKADQYLKVNGGK